MPAGSIARYGGQPRATLTLSSAPSNEIITTAEAKEHLAVDHSNDDTWIDALVKASRTMCEEWLNRSFLSTTWVYSLDANHPVLTQDYIELPMAPLQSITSVTSLDDDNNATALASANYYAVTNGDPGRVALVNGSDWPTDLRQYDSVRITYVAGWGNAVANIPTQYREWVKRGVLLTVAALYENRGDVRPGGAFTFQLPDSARDVLFPLKVY